LRARSLTLLAAVAVTAFAMSAVPAAASIPSHPRWESSAPFGAWNNGGFILYNNEWNQPTGPQTIWSDTYHFWGVESTQAAGNTAVETYPCVQKDFSNPLVSSFRLIRNGFTESMPATTAGLDAEAADDVWLNDYQIEVMIWVDNHGQRPAGSVIGHATIAGQQFAVWGGGSTFTFALDHTETTGKTHILASIDWLMAHGDVPSNATLTQVNFGWEIASTASKPEDFTVTSYWLHTTQS